MHTIPFLHPHSIRQASSLCLPYDTSPYYYKCGVLQLWRDSYKVTDFYKFHFTPAVPSLSPKQSTYLPPLSLSPQPRPHLYPSSYFPSLHPISSHLLAFSISISRSSVFPSPDLHFLFPFSLLPSLIKHSCWALALIQSNDVS